MFDQWFFVKPKEKEHGKSNFDRKRHDFPWKIYWIGKNFLSKVTVKVSIIYLLPSTPLMGILLAPLKLNVYFPGKTLLNVVSFRFTIREVGNKQTYRTKLHLNEKGFFILGKTFWITLNFFLIEMITIIVWMKGKRGNQ